MPFQPERPRILVSDGGFELAGAVPHPIAVGWSQVNQINAFKRDLFSIDLICFEFYLEKGTVVEVDEEMENFDRLVEVLPVRFEGFDTGWWDKVAKPAFATNFTEVWRRS